MRSIGLTVSSRSCFSSSGKLTNAREQIGERVRPLGDVHLQDVQQLFRVLRVALDELLEQRQGAVHQLLGLDVLRDRPRRDLAQAGLEVRLVLQHLHELDALPALQEELVAVRRERQPLHDRREHADLREVLGARILLVAGLLAEGGDQVLVVGETLQQAHVAVDADLQREHAPRKEHRGDERDDRQAARNVELHPVLRAD